VASISLEIVTPEGSQLKQDVDYFTAPSVEGEFGVLPGHRPLLASLQTGIVSFDVGGKQTRVAVGSGFVQVTENRVLVLTDRFMRKEDIDAVRVRLDLKDADEGLAAYTGEPGSGEYLELMARELWAAAQLELYGDPPPPTLRTHHEGEAVKETYRGDDDNDSNASPS